MISCSNAAALNAPVAAASCRTTASPTSRTEASSVSQSADSTFAHAQRHGDIVNALDSEMHVPLQGPLRPQKRLGLGDTGCQIRKPLRQRRGREARHTFARHGLLGGLDREADGPRIGLRKAAGVFDQNEAAAAVGDEFGARAFVRIAFRQIGPNFRQRQRIAGHAAA
jgi:hypothetical protein